MKCIVLAISAMVLCLCGCASLVSGPNQHIPITSNPPGATVKINGDVKGTTPLAVDLKRTQYHSISIELAGYHPYQIETTKGVNPWLGRKHRDLSVASMVRC